MEGTLLRQVLSHTIFLFTLVLSFFIGSRLVENGVTSVTPLDIVLLPILYSLQSAPLDRLMSHSRNWFEGGNGTAVIVIMYSWGCFLERQLETGFERAVNLKRDT